MVDSGPDTATRRREDDDPLHRPADAAPVSAVRLATRWIGLALAVGVVAGLVWWRVSPRVPLLARGGDLFPQEFQPRGYIAADAIFALITVGCGVVLTLAGLSRLRDRPLALVWSGAIGGLGGAGLAALVGTRLGSVDLVGYAASAPDGTVIDGPLQIHVFGVLVLWAIVAVGMVAAAELWDWIGERWG